MDINSPLEMSVSEDVNRFHDLNQLSLDRPGVTEDDFLSDLRDGLTEFLHIEDDISNVEKEDTWEDPSKTELTVVTSEECLCKCATFPSSDGTISASSADGKEEGKYDNELDEITGDVLKENISGSKKPAYNPIHLPTSLRFIVKEEEEEEENDDQLDDITANVLNENGYVSNKPPYHPVPLPTPLKLVSAMKGSREKHGISPKKLTVTWAPDVYDPLPTAASHVPTNKKQRHRSDNRKNGKNKQKGKRGKDKNKVRKHGGSSNKCFKTLDNEDRLLEHHKPFADLGGFDIGSPDSYCGSSFLKSSVTNMHFSVAEAT